MTRQGPATRAHSRAAPVRRGRVSPLEALQRRDFEAAHAIARSGAAALADEATTRRAPSGRVVGAPRYFTNEALFTGLVYTALQHGSLSLTKVAEAINLLPDDCLSAIGLRRDAGTGRAVNLSQVDHAWNRLAEACNPSPVREGRRRRLDEQGAPVHGPKRHVVDRKYLHPELGEKDLAPAPTRRCSTRGAPRVLCREEAERREALLNAILDALLLGSIPDGLAYDAVMLDWTDHETAARMHSKRAASADPDATYGRRRPKNHGLRFTRNGTRRQRRSTPASPGQEPGSSRVQLDQEGFETDKNEPFFGYNIHFAVGVGAVSDPRLPELALGMRMTPANDMAVVAPIAVELVDVARRAAPSITTAGVDLGYSMRRPENLHVPLSERGVFLLYDYAQRDYGRHGTHKGAVLLNGVPHCPFTPPARRTKDGDDDPLVVPSSTASREEWKEYWRLRDAQDRFQFRPLGRGTPDLKQRYQCPAAAGRVRCSFYASSLSLPYRADTPDIDVLRPEGEEPLACCGRSFTVGPEVGLGRRQDPVHGSRDWVRSYDRRSAVERFNAKIKEFGIDRMDVRVLGRTKRSLMVAVAAVATNITLARRHAQESVGHELAA